ncbi:hypothetical protein OSTOST_15414 [Ostertagia ostertagi]
MGVLGDELLLRDEEECAIQDTVMASIAATAYTSGGNVAFTNGRNLHKYMDAFLPTLYGTSTLTNPTYDAQFKCVSHSDWYVEIDKNTSSIFVAASSRFGSIGVVNPLKHDIATDVLFNVAGTKLYRIDTEGLPGTYTLSLRSPGACYVHVYSYGGAKVYTEFASTTADDPLGSHIDGQHPHPAPGARTIATFHLEGTPGHEGYLHYVEAFSHATQKVVLRSDLYRRSTCTFEYYSDPFVCQEESLEFSIYGVDEWNQEFRRMEQFFCVDHGHIGSTAVPNVTLSSPIPTTTHSAVPRFDILFLIDVSKEAENGFDDMYRFVASLMSAFDVSQQNARVALIAVRSDEMGSIPVAKFTNINSYRVLLAYVNRTKLYADFKHDGQAIEE